MIGLWGMDETRYVAIQGRGMTSFIFQAQLEQDSDGRRVTVAYRKGSTIFPFEPLSISCT